MTVLVPSYDPFYEPVAAEPAPGEVRRSRPISPSVIDGAQMYQVVYGSTGTRDQQIAVSGTVFVPEAPWHGPGPRPILSYGVGVHGLGRDAAPSYLMRVGRETELPQIQAILDRGWAVAITDGDGLGMPGPHTYGAGLPGGYAMLDIVRAAARHVPDLEPAPTVVWGYSEGGRYAAWAAELQPTYAPEVDLVAVAAGGVPADLYAVGKAIDGGPYSGLALAVVVGLMAAHDRPELENVVNERGRAALALAAELDVFGLVLGYPDPMSVYATRDEPFEDPAWRDLLASEDAGQRRPAVPVHLLHAAQDEIVPLEVGARLRDDYRALGADVTWEVVDAPDHLSGGPATQPAALDRLAAALDEVAAQRSWSRTIPVSVAT